MTEGPYKLPEGWRWVRLGEVCEINPRRPRLHVDSNEPTTFVPMTDVDDQSGTIVSHEARSFKHVRQGYTYIEEGDVLFAKITPCMENGKAAIAQGLLHGFGFGSTEFHVLRPVGSVIPEWIWLFIRQERFRKAAKASFRGGVGQQRVPKDFLESHLIPLPPLSEQRRIVARVEDLMSRVREAKRLREQAREDAERLWQSVLADTFPRHGSPLPEGWRWVKLGKVCHLIEIGFAFRKRGAPEGDLLHLRPYNIGENGNVNLSQRFLVPSNLCPRNRRMLQPGDVLFNNTNSVELVGKTALVTEVFDAAFSNHITLLRTQPEQAEGAWVALALQALWHRSFFAKHCNKWIGQAGINTATLRTFHIPLPPLSEQRRIVAYLEAVQQKVKALKEAQAATEAELKRLEQAILERAFRGEL